MVVNKGGPFVLRNAGKDLDLANGVEFALFFRDQNCGVGVNRGGTEKAKNVAKDQGSSKYQGSQSKGSFAKKPNFELSLDEYQCGITFEGTNAPRLVKNSFLVIKNREKVVARISSMEWKM